MPRLTSQKSLLIGTLALLACASLGIGGAATMVDRTFPGFLVLSNGVIASATAPGWPATEGGEIYQHEVVSVDGVTVETPGDVYRIARLHAAATPLVYRLRNPLDGREFERTIPTRHFSTRDALLLYGVYLLNGLVLGLTGLLVAWRGRGSEAARSTVPFLLIGAVWGLSALDLYGPYRLFRIHALAEALLAPAILQMALGFPSAIASQRTRDQLTTFGYTVAGCLALSYQSGLYLPAAYVSNHLVATSGAGIALLIFVASQLWRFGSRALEPDRRPPPTVLIGTLLALVLPIGLSIAEPYTGGAMPQSAIGYSVFVFPLSLLWATTRDRIFDPVSER